MITLKEVYRLFPECPRDFLERVRAKYLRSTGGDGLDAPLTQLKHDELFLLATASVVYRTLPQVDAAQKASLLEFSIPAVMSYIRSRDFNDFFGMSIIDGQYATTWGGDSFYNLSTQRCVESLPAPPLTSVWIHFEGVRQLLTQRIEEFIKDADAIQSAASAYAEIKRTARESDDLRNDAAGNSP